MDDAHRPALELIRRSQAGDEAAFAALFEQYKNLVRQPAALLIANARVDTPEAEEALQEVFGNVYLALAEMVALAGSLEAAGWRR